MDMEKDHPYFWSYPDRGHNKVLVLWLHLVSGQIDEHSKLWYILLKERIHSYG